MIQLQLNSVKEFMNNLLLLDYFNHFLCVSGEITTFNTFSIDGFIHQDYYRQGINPPDENHQGDYPSMEYSTWSDLKEHCHSIIKGKKPPLGLKFIFKLPEVAVESFLEKYNLDYPTDEIQGLYLNIRFESQKLYITTGTTLKTFSLSKDIERAWDSELISLMDELNMNYHLE